MSFITFLFSTISFRINSVEVLLKYICRKTLFLEILTQYICFSDSDVHKVSESVHLFNLIDNANERHCAISYYLINGRYLFDLG